MLDGNAVGGSLAYRKLIGEKRLDVPARDRHVQAALAFHKPANTPSFTEKPCPQTPYMEGVQWKQYALIRTGRHESSELTVWWCIGKTACPA